MRLRHLRLFHICFFLFIIQSGMTQADSLWKAEMDTIEMVALPSFPFQEEGRVTHRTIGGDFFEGLQSSAVQVQNNGPGLLATPLIHGMGARHTAVLWNGLNLQSPVNGTIDLQLLRNSLTMEVVPSSISPASGTAASSGAILLREGRRQTKLGLRFNTMDNFEFQIGTQLSLGDIRWRFDLQTIDNQNRYNYLTGNEERTQENAVFSGTDLKVGAHRQTAVGWDWKVNLWWQTFDRDIAPSKTAAYNDARQSDDNVRLFIGLKKKSLLQVNAGFLQERIIYQDAGIYSEARNRALILRVKSDLKFVELFSNFRSDHTTASFYRDGVSRSNIGLGAIKTLDFSSRWQGSITLRQEFVDDFSPPLLYDASVRYRVNDYWKVIASVDRSYNLPTFNDLYWPTGGNPDLLPESGRGYDITISRKKKDHWSVQFMLYEKRVNNWILWSPMLPFWTPSNQRKVRSRGFDFTMNYDHTLGQGILEHQVDFYYNNTTILEDNMNGDFVGKQLIYVPNVRWTTRHLWKINKWKFQVFGHYFGNRFTSFDNENELNGFFTIDLNIGKKTGSHLNWFLTIHNLTNTNYEQVAFFPMPLRSFTFGIKYQ